jgi:hypothetical protein
MDTNSNNNSNFEIWMKNYADKDDTRPIWEQRLTIAYEYILSDEWGVGQPLACMQEKLKKRKTRK